MKLDNLDEVTMLRNHRRRAETLSAAAASGPIDLRFAWRGDHLDAFSVISAEPVRQAVMDSCAEFIADIDKKLFALGVSVEPAETRLRDAASWERDCRMYARAWIRELGGKLIPKAHLIDSLVLTTRRLREAQTIEARRAETAQQAPSQDESVTRRDAPEIPVGGGEQKETTAALDNPESNHSGGLGEMG